MYDGGSANPNRILFRGRNWDYGSYTGVYTLYTRFDSTHTNFVVGFRCVRN